VTQAPTQQKYVPVKKLDAGGMAEVFIADAVGVHGIAKRVAIKRVLPGLAANAKFVAMFLDEARVAMNLSHANIVQTFDVGEEDGSYFIVMEFVDGTSLKNLIEHRRERDKLIPMGAAITIVIEACKGLSYAHNAVDIRNKPLDIVHRDISPPNLLLSLRGEVKVTDFGLAKAASQLETTDPGVVKGKFSYLSPEVIQGLPVDHRTDLFALGIILWEMLTGKRLFYGENEYQTVQLVEQCHIPSISLLNPAVPQVLDDIVFKALTKDRELRYQQGDEFADALTSFLFSSGLKASTRDIAALVREARHMGDAHSDGDADLADLLVEGELLSGLTLDESAAAPQAFDAAGPVEDTRGWITDLGLDEAPAAEPPKAPPSYGASTAAPPPAPEPKGGLLRRLFGGGKKSE
jgi:eukaryotic-like serine/threonine-protein kinase